MCAGLLKQRGTSIGVCKMNRTKTEMVKVVFDGLGRMLPKPPDGAEWYKTTITDQDEADELNRFVDCIIIPPLKPLDYVLKIRKQE